MKKIIVLICVVCCVFDLSAMDEKEIPVSDSAQLGLVIVTGKKLQTLPKLNLNSFNQAQNKFKNAGDLLKQNGISVRSNGPGVLTLGSIRGLYGNQMNILWEGLNIQSPMNGNFDLSLLPVFFMDEVQLLQHHPSSHAGNAALSGSLSFHSIAESLKNQAVVYFLLGSFGQRFYGGDVAWDSKKYYARTRVFQNRAAWDYPILGYEHTHFRKKQVNNDFVSTGILQEIGIKIKPNQNLNFKLWYQESDRGLSESITVQNPQSRQRDDILRLYANYDFGKRVKKYVKTAFFDETIIFKGQSGVESPSRSQTYIYEFGASAKLAQNLMAEIGANHTLNAAHVESYNGFKSQHLVSAFMQLHYHYKDVRANFALRQQTDNFQFLFPAPSLGIVGKISNQLHWRASSSISFRIPTFNDRFWNPGGNPDLLAEKAFKKDVGVEYANLKHLFSYSIFHNNVNDMLVWLPGLNGYWEAFNIRGVRVLGSELKYKYSYKIAEDQRFELGIFGSYTSSVYAKAEEGNEHILGNQLIFIPKHMLQGNISYFAKNIELNWISNFTGLRFTSTDNSRLLPNFWIHDLSINYSFKQFVFGFVVNNILKEAYQLFPERPMPGRSFQINFKLNI